MAGRNPRSHFFRGAASLGEPKKDHNSPPSRWARTPSDRSFPRTPSPRSIPSSRELNNYRNPSPPPFIRLEGGRPAQLTHVGNLPRVDEETCVRHVYLLYQQPYSGADDDESPRDRGVPIVPGPEAIPIEALAAHEVYPPADARLDWVGRVHVLYVIGTEEDWAIEPMLTHEGRGVESSSTIREGPRSTNDMPRCTRRSTDPTAMRFPKPHRNGSRTSEAPRSSSVIPSSQRSR